MELWLIRHPRPQSSEGVCYGRLDLDLAAGAAEAALAGLRLPPINRLRTSPAMRCREFARRLHEAPVEDARLSERHFGQWEGRTWDAIGRNALDAWAADPWEFAPPGGESARMLLKRVDAALREETASGGVAAWVTHQGVIRAAAGLLLGLPDKEWMSLRVEFGEARRFVKG